ncbi:enolase C-terminal domain-like protein [Pelagicoccus enzymogenes]|uniref:enolase C-terminal domain-like protein n=1 Tax=Pelagicoccus enzymogenes TaxID=2773457 RepID=UPI00280EAD86|nr:enolase C-terminal domain-like protein [Pelagicoccus enzymogenes]MDQ8198038.1 enolase C-terminal domain-like protein [Pelagicoccus enzymogenes]
MIRLLEQRIHFSTISTRMPFRYGIATMTRLPIAFVFLKFQFGESRSESAWGMASDLLPPRWFKKDPNLAPEAEIAELKAVLNKAIETATGLRTETPFAFWDQLYRAQLEWAEAKEIPPLLANFGTSFVERALLDAFSRHQQTPLCDLIYRRKLGIELGPLHPELYGLSPVDLLPEAPLSSIQVRHTVGFGDPLRDSDITPENQVADALPQSLEAAILHYGISQFKVKINGRLDEDLARLRSLAQIFAEHCPQGYALSLDGNEQFENWPQFRAFWEQARAEPALQALLNRVLFIEQPLSRHNALCDKGIGKLSDGSETPPVIIDESDAGPESFRDALDCGYRGISHKNCKGVFKGIANRCLIEYRNQKENTGLFMSGEDLCNLGPVALLQDLAAQSLLGNASVERNGHHYFYGLSQFPAAVQELVCKHHPELFEKRSDQTAALTIRGGSLPTAGLHEAPFGTRFQPEELAAALGLSPLS